MVDCFLVQTLICVVFLVGVSVGLPLIIFSIHIIDFIYHPVNISAAVGRIVSFSCGFVGISPPNWIVTGMPDNSFTVSPNGTVGNYYYPFPHDANATLQTITGVTEDVDGLCARCVIAVVGGTFYSETGCLSIAGM